MEQARVELRAWILLEKLSRFGLFVVTIYKDHASRRFDDENGDRFSGAHLYPFAGLARIE